MFIADPIATATIAPKDFPTRYQSRTVKSLRLWPLTVYVTSHPPWGTAFSCENAQPRTESTSRMQCLKSAWINPCFSTRHGSPICCSLDLSSSWWKMLQLGHVWSQCKSPTSSTLGTSPQGQFEWETICLSIVSTLSTDHEPVQLHTFCDILWLQNHPLVDGKHPLIIPLCNIFIYSMI